MQRDTQNIIWKKERSAAVKVFHEYSQTQIVDLKRSQPFQNTVCYKSEKKKRLL